MLGIVDQGVHPIENVFCCRRCQREVVRVGNNFQSKCFLLKQEFAPFDEENNEGPESEETDEVWSRPPIQELLAKLRLAHTFAQTNQDAIEDKREQYCAHESEP